MSWEAPEPCTVATVQSPLHYPLSHYSACQLWPYFLLETCVLKCAWHSWNLTPLANVSGVPCVLSLSSHVLSWRVNTFHCCILMNILVLFIKVVWLQYITVTPCTHAYKYRLVYEWNVINIHDMACKLWYQNIQRFPNSSQN